MTILKKVVRLSGFVMMVGTLAACAPADLALMPTYTATGTHKGQGQLVLGLAGEGTDRVERVQFVYGEVRSRDGKIKGNVVGPAAPQALMRDALQQELVKSGYDVRLEPSQVQQAERGVMLATASLTMDEVASLVKIEAECKAQMTLELWQRGTLIRRLTYSKTMSDFAVRDREKLHQQLLQKTLSTVMQAAAADLAVYFK